MPAQALPEFQPGLVVAQNEQVTAMDAHAHQGEHATPHQRLADALPAMGFSHSQVMDVAMSPVTAAQRRSDNLTLVDGNVTQVRVALQEAFDALMQSRPRC